jgi:hypothetical protein
MMREEVSLRIKLNLNKNDFSWENIPACLNGLSPIFFEPSKNQGIDQINWASQYLGPKS